MRSSPASPRTWASSSPNSEPPEPQHHPDDTPGRPTRPPFRVFGPVSGTRGEEGQGVSGPWRMRWQVAAGVVAILALPGGSASAAWIFPGGSAGARAVVAVSSGRAVRTPEPTYRWHGLRVPVGACGAMVHGRPWVLPCNDKRVVAYRRHVAHQRSQKRDAAAGTVVLGAAVAAVALLRRRRSGHPRTGRTVRHGA